MGCNQDLEFYSGEDVSLTLNFTQNGAALDVHGCTIWFTANDTKGDATPLAQQYYVLGSGDGVDGTYIFIIPRSITDNLVEGSYYYDFQLLKDTYITTLGSGRLTVKTRVTVAVSTP